MNLKEEYIKFKNYEEVIIPINEIDHDGRRLCPLFVAINHDIALYGVFYLSKNDYNNMTEIGFKLTNPLEHAVECDLKGVAIQ